MADQDDTDRYAQNMRAAIESQEAKMDEPTIKREMARLLEKIKAEDDLDGELTRLRAEAARLTEVSEAWKRGFAERGVEMERLTAEVERERKLGEACSRDCNAVALERNELRAEVERLTEVSSAWQRGFAERGEEMERLTAEVEALRADAERWQWWRGTSGDNRRVLQLNIWLRGDELDAAIDAARGAT